MTKTFTLEHLGCANCACKMETAIKKLNGVSDCTINFFTTRLLLICDDNQFDEIFIKLQKIIKKIEPYVVIK